VGLGLAKKMAAIDPRVRQPEMFIPVVSELPMTEVRAAIKKLCFPGMHYPDLLSVVGKLVSGGIADHDVLLENRDVLDICISPDSDENNSERAILDHKKGYPGQFGSRPAVDVPADCFGSEVYNNLPKSLKGLCDLVNDYRKKDVVLQGLITALSAAASRFRFYHGSDGDMKEYSPHLLSLTIGAAGSGKGLNRYGNVLVDLISHRAVEMHKIALGKYKLAKAEFDRQIRDCGKNNKSTDHLAEPTKPVKYRFAISASDTTQAALVETLFHNPIGGYAFDTEVDTMVQGNAKKDFGGYSDVIRKAAHHEPLSRQRKGDDESYIVQYPRLAVMFSGTHDQLKKLIPSEYNGLFSRFWFYIIPAVFQEYKTAIHKTDILGQACMELQQWVMATADLWSDELHYLQFSVEQEQDLWNAMQDKKSMEERFGGDIGASWLRMALITKRIAVTLAAFDGCTGGIVPDNCWKAALGILKAMKTHCIQALNIIRQRTQGKIDISEIEYNKMKESGMTDEEVAGALGVTRKTLHTHKKQWQSNVQNV
jgi:hypothetical protein